MKNENQNSLFVSDSLTILSHKIVSQTQELLLHAKTEEDLRVGFETILGPVLADLSIKGIPKYERSIFNAGRPDALHGQVVIEYEPPLSFRKQKAVEHAFSQLVGYIQGLSQAEKESLFIFGSKFKGVGFDGEKIFFVRYKGEIRKPKYRLDEKDFVIMGPYDFNENSALTFLTYLRALSRLPLTAENLLEKFGPKSKIASEAISALVHFLKYWGQTKVNAFFNEWKRLFGIVYGEKFNDSEIKESELLSRLYKIDKKADFQELLFSIHTYFAFLMKMIVAELITLRDTVYTSSFAFEIAHYSNDELKAKLKDIENGEIYAQKGISNFLEGDFFCWYLEAWSPNLQNSIRNIARALSEFEPATNIIEPNATRDLLKRLYQYLVPKEIRHNLGEYYTPDWLAELLLNEVGYNGNTLKRFLDPACGSGTFLVLAIQRAKESGAKEKWPPLEIAKRIIANIWGFDLNPLAVIAARTNYLFALGDLANELRNLEVPIYLADSVLWPEQVGGQSEINFKGGECHRIKTSIGDFYVPSVWIKDKGFLIKDAAPLVEKFAKEGYDSKIAMKHLREKGLVFPPHEKVVENFYEKILELEKQNNNGIWARFLKNAFAPMVAGKFDFVVGNPPWIRWDYLSQEYRNATLQLWKDYGLFSLKGFQSRLGGGKKDFSMLFIYASADYYLKEKAKLGFLVTQEVFKSKSAGEGFRKFRLGKSGNHLRVLKAHDLVTIQPFEGAANKTAAIVIKKGEKIKYPVPYLIWSKKAGVGKIATEKSFAEVLPLLQKKGYIAKPIGSNVGAWQTQLSEAEGLTSVEGRNYYKAVLGANPNPYGVFWLELKYILSDGNIIIRNLTEMGRWKIPLVEEKIETDLIYPAIRGADIERWGIKPKILMLVVQDPKTRRGHLEEYLKNNYPYAYGYLLRFKDILLMRPLYKKYHKDTGAPFYSQFNISEQTFARYKVVWKRMTNDLIAAVISEFKSPFGYKTIIPLETTALISTDNEPEAHYLCSIINSHPVRDFIKSFSSAGRGFGTPSVMEHVGIPKFDPKNELHQKLAKISIKCHQLRLESNDIEIIKLERENDLLVKNLFRISE